MSDARFHRLLAGETNGFGGRVARAGLRCLSVAYSAAVRLRNRAYDAGLAPVHRAPVPVVSVGNLTTGGTGKTPVVAFLASWFQKRGVQACLLSRGYRSLDGAANDEKLVLDRLCPGIPHLQAPDRVASARIAYARHGAQVLILDDGFQHRRLARELDLVLIDALDPWGYGHLLPRGLLREPLSSLRRADVIVLTRADLCPAQRREEILSQTAAAALSTGEAPPLVEVAFAPQSLVNSGGAIAPVSHLAGIRLAAFCGIGNPDGFRRTLAAAGLPVAESRFRAFPDHHHYSPADLARIARHARDQGAEALVTTQKDLVKIGACHLEGIPLWALEIGAQMLAGADRLTARLEAIAASAMSPACV